MGFALDLVLGLADLSDIRIATVTFRILSMMADAHRTVYRGVSFSDA